MNKTIKLLICIIITLIISIIILDKLTLLFVRKGNGYGSDVLNFYKQKKNSIDIVYLGSSHTYTSFNPYLIEEETGLNGYVFATQQQPIWLTYYYLKETLKYQKPKYVVIDVHMLVSMNDEYAKEQVNRDAIDKMRFSLNKLEAINASVKSKERVTYYFNIIKYHSRYKDLDDRDYNTVFEGYSVDNKGYTSLNYKNRSFKKEDVNINSEEEKIYYKNRVYLEKIINLANNNNFQIIFVKTPAIYNKEQYAKLNYINNYLNKRNIKFINFIDNDILQLDYDKDFYDSGHLDKEGSEKFSQAFVKYIKEYN